MNDEIIFILYMMARDQFNNFESKFFIMLMYTLATLWL